MHNKYVVNDSVLAFLPGCFGEGLRLATDRLNSKNFYACNPSFDKNCGK